VDHDGCGGNDHRWLGKFPMRGIGICRISLSRLHAQFPPMSVLFSAFLMLIEVHDEA
jgi:hypothetical protein